MCYLFKIEYICIQLFTLFHFIARLFLTLHDQKELMIKMDEKAPQENCETISIRFSDPKLDYKVKIRSIASFSVSDSF